MEYLPSFILAGVALTGSPGPNTLGLAGASAAYGLRGSLMLLGGAIVGVYAVILATATGLTQGRPDGFELPDGSRQISASGSRYRGPGASATGPIHHYLMELYALDTMLEVKVPPQGPQDPNPNPQANCQTAE